MMGSRGRLAEPCNGSGSSRTASSSSQPTQQPNTSSIKPLTLCSGSYMQYTLCSPRWLSSWKFLNTVTQLSSAIGKTNYL
mmetsp:Transcript_58001/g.115026  ORF Transcript_58001/g.115026 Transcript_58001/m.115026 type:complete len:80 (-) Transcript_58001:61-300(-)